MNLHRMNDQFPGKFCTSYSIDPLFLGSFNFNSSISSWMNRIMVISTNSDFTNIKWVFLKLKMLHLGRAQHNIVQCKAGLGSIIAASASYWIPSPSIHKFQLSLFVVLAYIVCAKYSCISFHFAFGLGIPLSIQSFKYILAPYVFWLCKPNSTAQHKEKIIKLNSGIFDDGKKIYNVNENLLD